MGMVRNKLGYAIPVHDWDVFQYLRGIALSRPVPRDGEEIIPDRGSWPAEWDFVWVSTVRPAVGVFNTDGQRNQFSEIPPRCFALSGPGAENHGDNLCPE